MKLLAKITPLQQGALTLALGLLLSGGIYYTGISPAQEKLATVQGRNQEQAQLVANVRALSQQEDYPLYVREQEEQLDYLQGRLPQQLELEALVASYYALAEQEGVSLERLQLPQPGQEAKQKGLLLQKLQLQAQGPYYALVNFLQRLEQEGSYVRLEQVRLQYVDQEQVRLAAQLLLYSRTGAEKNTSTQVK